MSEFKRCQETGRWFTMDGVKISGVALALRQRNPDTQEWTVDICEENRVTLTGDEQDEIGSAQPYLLPDEDLLDKDGEPISTVTIGKIIHKNRNKLNEIEEISEDDANNIVDECRKYTQRFKGRHFKHVVLRERLKKNDISLEDAVRRLLSEEACRKFKQGKGPGKHSLIYVRQGSSSAVITWVVDIADTCLDTVSLKKRGFCNWFSPKKCPEICDNDYFETRNHSFVSMEIALKTLVDFQTTYNDYDLSRWGGLAFFKALSPYIFEG